MTREYLMGRLFAVNRKRIELSFTPWLREDFEMYTLEEKRLRKLLGWGRNRP